MYRLLLVISILVLTGCENGNLTLTDKSRSNEKAKIKKRGDMRVVLFKECMALTALIPRQADDDVADIVKECSNQAFYMTNFIE